MPGLDAIDWSRLQGPYGKSGEVPHAIRALWSDDAEARANAVTMLQQNLWHQGAVYEVTAPAVPFVADAALRNIVSREDRIWLVALLAWIASGSSALRNHRGFLESWGHPVADSDVQRELGWVRDAHEAVRRRLPEFLARLDVETDPSTQIVLALLAAQFPKTRRRRALTSFRSSKPSVTAGVASCSSSPWRRSALRSTMRIC